MTGAMLSADGGRIISLPTGKKLISKYLRQKLTYDYFPNQRLIQLAHGVFQLILNHVIPWNDGNVYHISGERQIKSKQFIYLLIHNMFRSLYKYILGNGGVEATAYWSPVLISVLFPLTMVMLYIISIWMKRKKITNTECLTWPRIFIHSRFQWRHQYFSGRIHSENSYNELKKVTREPTSYNGRKVPGVIIIQHEIYMLAPCMHEIKKCRIIRC